MALRDCVVLSVKTYGPSSFRSKYSSGVCGYHMTLTLVDFSAALVPVSQFPSQAVSAPQITTSTVHPGDLLTVQHTGYNATSLLPVGTAETTPHPV